MKPAITTRVGSSPSGGTAHARPVLSDVVLAVPLHCIDFASPSLAMELDAIVHLFLNGHSGADDPLALNREVRAIDTILHGLLGAEYLPAELLMGVRTRLEALYLANGLRVQVAIRPLPHKSRTNGSILRVTVSRARQRDAAFVDYAGPPSQAPYHMPRLVA